MNLTVNGEAWSVAEGSTLAGLLAELNLSPGRLACEVNGALVRRVEVAAHVLADGDTVEIVQMIGGG